MKGGKREGAGRPPVPPRPLPVSWRPDTQAQRDKWLELGGARWVKRLLNAAQQPSASPVAQLTDDQIEACVQKVWGSFAEFDEVRLFTRTIEAALTQAIRENT